MIHINTEILQVLLGIAVYIVLTFFGALHYGEESDYWKSRIIAGTGGHRPLLGLCIMFESAPILAIGILVLLVFAIMVKEDPPREIYSLVIGSGSAAVTGILFLAVEYARGRGSNR